MKNTLLIALTIFLGSCTSMSYKKAIEELQNMPPADYSYIIQ